MSKDAEKSVNEPSTGEKIDTPLTQPRYGSVRDLATYPAKPSPVNRKDTR